VLICRIPLLELLTNKFLAIHISAIRALVDCNHDHSLIGKR
jgi:hypothetical protein